MIRVSRPAEAPEVLATRGNEETRALCAAWDEGRRNFSGAFKDSIYSHASVKQALIEAQHGKCCFCETRIRPADNGAVEHFRPKTRMRPHPDAALETPGYYWLAYSWANFLFSCTRCNSNHKGDHFPLEAGTARASSHHEDVATESPMLIDPAAEDPGGHIAWRDEQPYALDDSPRGGMTLRILKLDNPDLSEARFSYLTFLWKIYQKTRQYPDDPDFMQILDEAQEDHSEYAAMTRAAISEWERGGQPSFAAD